MKNKWYHITPSYRWFRCHVCGHLFPHSDYRFQTKITHLDHPDFGSECDRNIAMNNPSMAKYKKGYWHTDGRYISYEL